MGIRDDLISVVDDLRRDIVDEAFEMRLDSVVVRTVYWSGTEPGRGTKSVSDLTLDPVPKVSNPGPKLRAAEPGKYEDGDVTVTRISATYTRDQLEGVWLVNGKSFRVVSIDEEYLQWRVHLRAMRVGP